MTALPPASADAPRAAERRLEAPVTRVVLLEDRAQVTRRARLHLEPGAHRLTIPEVTPLVADRTLYVRGLRADDVRVVRSWKVGAREQPPDVAALRERIAALRSDVEQRDELLAALERRGELATQALRLRVEALNREVAWGAAGEEGWEDPLAGLMEEVRGLDARSIAARDELDGLRKRLEELEGALAHEPAADRWLSAALVVDLTVEEPGERGLEVGYTVPCALWRPIHRATLLDGPRPEVRVEAEGAVWQATGEDWRDVELAFSTARPTQRSEPPLLVDDVLRVRPRQEKTTTVELREEVIETTGEGTAAAVDDGLPGVDDGGETRLLRAAAPVTLPSDGRMHRVPIATSQAAAEVDRICRPELAPLVHLRSRQANEAAHPLLAGPVDLLRGSGYVGRGELSFVGAGERFALGWGSEDGIRVTREVEEERKKAKLTGKQTIARTIRNYLSNLEDRPVRFALEERVPVSELAKVTIEVDRQRTQPSVQPDEQGIVRWEVELPPHGTQEVRLAYTIVASSDVRGL